jgi:uncharacterized protein YhbP (UPF0306 family)
MVSDLNQLAKNIIQNCQYMTIASSDSDGKPWASPVAYVYDKDFNFYWVSVPDCQHQRNIKVNPNVVISIFDSHQLWGEGEGVQLEAEVEQVGITKMPAVAELYFTRDYPYGNALGAFGQGLKDLLKGKIYHFYKATPTKVWVPDPDAVVDARIEVSLN